MDNFVCNSLLGNQANGLAVLDALWSRLVEALEGKMPTAALDSWVRPCRLLQVQGDHLRIAAPNKYTRDWLYQHHADALQAAARAVLGLAAVTVVPTPGRKVLRRTRSFIRSTAISFSS